ncbi:Transposon Ty3-I Gag-Pol polyprotein [Labeo rohita]|uniref:ribonuclease H n=1 Tax=Labeo rohita TaxID=84645 RepID=A0ABQ8M696_LABRO|nr:Transposon Ty3-I Gag-Pol polyprotein [Labeo rohita]
MKAYIKEELAKGFIRPSTSPASAGFFFVKKKDGGLRPCIDYCGLNEITVKFHYPLPLVPAALEQLCSARFFTKLDLRNAYSLIRIWEGDEWKTAFSTTTGHYEYSIMPFGLVNSPCVFQTFVNDIFRDILNQWVIIYIDDILIFSDTRDLHVQHVRAVLQRLIDNQLNIKFEKCEFHQTVTSFLGYIISAEGVAMDERKVNAVLRWPQPTTVKELQRFLGNGSGFLRGTFVSGGLAGSSVPGLSSPSPSPYPSNQKRIETPLPLHLNALNGGIHLPLIRFRLRASVCSALHRVYTGHERHNKIQVKSSRALLSFRYMCGHTVE